MVFDRRGSAAHEIQHFTRSHQIMQTVHDLLDGGAIVPKVHVQYVDVRGSKLAQGVFDCDVHGLEIVAHVVGPYLDRLVEFLVEVGVLEKNVRILISDVPTYTRMT